MDIQKNYIIKIDKKYFKISTDSKDRICSLKFIISKEKRKAARYLPKNINNLKKQFERYFHGRSEVEWNINYIIRGTNFQKKIWNCLKKIPYGKTSTYGEIAEKYFSTKKYSRAVGNACAANPLPIIFPCHRVISGTGNIGGFSAGIKMKQYLLNIEKQQI